MSDLVMNVHTCVTENTTYTMVYVTKAFYFVRFDHECAHVCYY